MSWIFFKSGNTVNTEYLNRIPNPESQIPNRSEYTETKITFTGDQARTQVGLRSQPGVRFCHNYIGGRFNPQLD